MPGSSPSRGPCRSTFPSTSARCAAPSRCSSPARSRTASTARSATTRPGTTTSSRTCKIGAERAGRDWTTLDIGAWCVVTCGPDSEKAKTAARAIVTFYLSSQPDEQFEAHGIDPDEVKAIVEILGKGELDKAYEMTTPEIAEKLSIAGTPEECTARIKEIESAGVNHMILCITDPYILKLFAQRDVDVPDVQGQLQLIADEVMPAFSTAGVAS